MIGLPNSVQVEKIADQFSSVSNEYSPIMEEDIDVESIMDTKPLQDINPYVIYLKIMGIKKKTSTVTGHVPMKLIKFCAEELSFPLAEIYERAIKHGEYPNVYKYERVIPVPKTYPPQICKPEENIRHTKMFSDFWGNNC